jgi:hypothetical protein
VDEGLAYPTKAVLHALARAQALFGADQVPADPPAFVARPDLEDHLGLGWY